MDLLELAKEEFLGVNTGISEVANDLQFANRFTARIHNPSKKIFDERDSYFIKSANIPSESIGVISRNLDGIKFSLANSREYDTANFVFYDAEGGKLRSKFLDWLGLIFNKETGRIGYHSNYKTTVSINILPTNSVYSDITTISLLDAYPTSVGDLNFSRDSKDTVAEFSVSFTYRKISYPSGNLSENTSTISNII